MQVKAKAMESGTHRDVLRILQLLNIKYRSEVKVDDGLFSIDIALIPSADLNDEDKQGQLKLPAKPILCIEVDGPTHFTSNTQQPLGHTLWRNEQLAALGWQVLTVPSQLWHRHTTDAAKVGNAQACRVA